MTNWARTHSAHGYDTNPEFFSVAEGKQFVGVVYGWVVEFEPVDTTVCEWIGVRLDRCGEELGRRLLARFEDGARDFDGDIQLWRVEYLCNL